LDLISEGLKPIRFQKAGIITIYTKAELIAIVIALYNRRIASYYRAKILLIL
jgi:hypothetical protein